MIKEIGIIGKGMIGNAISNLFKDKLNIHYYDPSYRDYATDEAKKAIDNCSLAFICVPTPLLENKLDMSYVEKVISEFSPGLFICSSTLQPGTANRLMKKYNKKIVVNPEYFGETPNHPLVNLKQQEFLILGGEKNDIERVIDLYKQVYNANIKIRKVSAYEAEIIKLSENRAIGFKIAQCQELYDLCQKAKVDYNTIREAVYGDDPRFNLWWTFIYREKRGFLSKCLPKDIYGWEHLAKGVGLEPELTTALLKYNDKLIGK